MAAPEDVSPPFEIESGGQGIVVLIDNTLIHVTTAVCVGPDK